MVLINAFKDIAEHFSQEIHQFEITIINRHFHIESSELTQMTMSSCLFSSEDWPNFKDSLEIRHHAHLLIELGRLSQTSITVEVFKFKHIGSTFRASSNQFRCMNFSEALSCQVVPKQLANTSRQLENSLFALRSQIHNSIIQSSLHLHNHLLL